MEMDFDKLIAQREEDNKTKANESSMATQHRRAVRKTAAVIEIEDNHGNCKTHKEKRGNQEFFYSPDEEVKITGDYHNVRIFITDLV